MQILGRSASRVRIGRLVALMAVIAWLAAFALGSGGLSVASAQNDTTPDATATLTEKNDSGVSGTATLVAQDATTMVTITLEGPNPGSYPAHLHLGTCDDIDPSPTYPLTNPEVGGTTTTQVELTLDELLSKSYVIIVHIQSGDLNELLNPNSYIACGEIVAYAPPTPSAPPSSGIGTTAMQSGGPVLWLGLMVVALGATALGLRRWDAGRS